MASSPNHSTYDLSLGLKQSYEPQNMSDLINDLRQNECGEEFKLLVLNIYLRKCQSGLPVAKVLEHEHSQCRSMILKGIGMLKKEITRINKGMGLKVPARLPMAFSTPYKQELDLNKLDVGDEGDGGILIHCHGKRQEANPSANQNSSFFCRPPLRARKGSRNMNLRQLKERPMIDFSRNPLTKPIWKNDRRHWTEELHARFLMVLDVLGGAEVVTPTEIRDHMQVDELTVEQVKSHLQKYRVIWRANHPQPQVVVRKPRKPKCRLSAAVEMSGAGSSMGQDKLSLKT
ncbi:myb-like transcription factor family protein [Euphorbia peplus]|nr:myb-like transcription factor family protein [Euphorbia peplus]